MITPQAKRGLDRYVKYRIPTGGFLRAVLENDFMRAIGKADIDNLCTITDIRDYILSELPIECYGTPEAVSKLLQGRNKV